ncbi:MAG: hypothetical protein J6J36_00465 [Clostridia bacterium]|nr:hypothetical protein [Clostridia bacterium]
MIFRALDKNNNEVVASYELERAVYYCPFCKHEMYLAKGLKQEPHFRHKNSGDAIECEYYNPSINNSTGEGEAYMYEKSLGISIERYTDTLAKEEIKERISSDLLEFINELKKNETVVDISKEDNIYIIERTDNSIIKFAYIEKNTDERKLLKLLQDDVYLVLKNTNERFYKNHYKCIFKDFDGYYLFMTDEHYNKYEDKYIVQANDWIIFDLFDM